MENQEKMSRRDALKRMSKAAMVIAAASMLPSVNALAADTPPKYSNYNDYKNYGNYGDYSNYENYKNYHDYSNYSNYIDCH